MILRNRPHLPSTLLLLAPLVSACGLDPEPMPRAHDAWIFQRAQEVRELDLLEEVPVRRISQDQFLAERQERIWAKDEERYRLYAETYGRLGFFDRDLDQRLLEMSTGRGILGYYQDGAITLIGEEGLDDGVYVHEVVHALQDQHFGWRDYVTVETTNAYVARRAVSEGGAELARERFLVQEESPGADLDDVPWGLRIAEEIDQSDRYLQSRPYPVVFAATVGIAYSHGLIYCAHNLLGVSPADPNAAPAPHDWSRQDALYTSPPDGGEAILTLDANDPRRPVGITEVPPSLEDRLERVDWDELGRWHSYLLFFPLRDEPGLDRPWDLAAAWDGDAALFVRDRDSEAIGLIWATRWDDATMAERVRRALAVIHGVSPDADAMPINAPDDEPLWLERRDDVVVFARHVEQTAMADLVNAAFDPPVAPTRPRRVYPSLAAWLDRRP